MKKETGLTTQAGNATVDTSTANTHTTNNGETIMTYRQLQQALKQLRDQGYTLTCKLNAKADVLQAEYDRLLDIEVDDAEKERVALQADARNAVIEECDGSSCDLPDGYYVARFKATVPATSPTTTCGSHAKSTDSVRLVYQKYLDLGFCSTVAMHCAKYNLKPSAAMKASPELALLQSNHSKAIRKCESKKQQKRVAAMNQFATTAKSWFSTLTTARR